MKSNNYSTFHQFNTYAFENSVNIFLVIREQVKLPASGGIDGIYLTDKHTTELYYTE